MQERMLPTKGNLISCKKNLALAKLGYELLDRKRNVLMREMMSRIEEASNMQKEIGDTFFKAYSALQNANVSLGIQRSLENYGEEENSFSVSSQSIMGVDLPKTNISSNEIYPSYGFSDTNFQFDSAYTSFDKVKKLCATLAGIENSVYRLARAIKKTQRRTNMLENIVIPRLSENIKYISSTLEEQDREEFTRMKVIKRQKESEKNNNL